MTVTTLTHASMLMCRRSTARNHISQACVRWSELQSTEMLHQVQCLNTVVLTDIEQRDMQQKAQRSAFCGD